MKKLVLASVALAAALVAVCSGSLLCSPAFALVANGQGAQGQTPANCASPTIKDPAEYNDYANATSQASPAAKADAIEAFLTKYPNSVAKAAMLEALMGAYQAAGNAAKILDAAKRLLQVEPNNLRALTFVVYLEHQQSNGNQQMLDDAATAAQTGLNAPKDSCMTQGGLRQGQGSRHSCFLQRHRRRRRPEEGLQGRDRRLHQRAPVL